MVRPPSFDSNGIKKGAWSEEEDQILRAFVHRFGHSNWRLLPVLAGLARCGKSCRLRWVNYLKPGVKRGNFSKEEEDLIIKLHEQVGNKWSIIASKLPGRTDNDIKNYWHAHIEKRGRRNATASRKSIMAAQTPQEDQSLCDQINNSCITTDNDDNHHKEESVFDNVFTQGLSAENMDALMNPINEQGQGGVWTETYDDQTCFSQLSIDASASRKSIMAAQTPQEDQSLCYQINNSCITTDNDDNHHKGESVFDNVFTQGLSAENIDALMNPINEQGQGGVWTETYDDQSCFSQLSIDVPPFKEEAEFYGFGLGHYDIMSTFSDSSDGGITSWNSSTAESDQVRDFWSELPFGEDSLHDIWCFADDDMNMLWH